MSNTKVRNSSNKRVDTGMPASIATTAMLAFAVAPGVTLAQSAAGSNTGKLLLEEIVVTAQKREQSIMDVPFAIQVFTGEMLAQSGVTSVQQLQTLTPGMTYDSNSTIGRLYIRGVGNSVAGNGLDPSVATYLDDRYVGHATTAMMQNFLDISRVEVLKGPQGTLFGRNATGGAIRLVTHEVTDEFEGSMKATVGNYAHRALEGIVNIPLAENLGVRLAATTTRHDGYYTNLFSGGRHDWFDQESSEFRAKVHWEMTDNLTSTLTVGYWEKDDLNGTATVINGPPAWNPYVAVAGLQTGLPADVLYSTGPNHVSSDITNSAPADEWTASYRLDWDADWFSFASITTADTYDISTVTDPDSTAGTVLDLVGGGDDGSDYSQEFQFLSNDPQSDFEWVVGVNYYYSDNTFTSRLRSAHPLLGIANISPGFQTIETEAWSVYGNFKYHFTDALSVEFGLRYSDETKDADLTPPPAGIIAPLPPSYYSIAHLSRNFDRTTPSVSLNYSTDWGTMFVRYSEGFKSGGYNYPLSLTEEIDPEVLKSYEVGLKSSLFDHALRLDANAFFYDYSDLQVTVATHNPIGVLSETRNAAEAEVQGLEVNATWLPFDGATVQVGASYTDGEYKDYKDASTEEYAPGYPGIFIDASGRDLLNLSPWQYFIQLGYESSVGEGTLAGLLSWSWRSEYDFDFMENTVQESYGLLNGRLTFTPSSDRWDISLWANNITDETYYTYKVSTTSGLAAPRTFGAEVAVRF